MNGDARREIEGVKMDTLSHSVLERWLNRFSHYSAVPQVRKNLAAAGAMWEQAGFGQNYDLVEATDFGLLFVPPAIDGSRPLTVQCTGSLGQLAVHDAVAGRGAERVFIRLLERAVMQSAQ